MMDKNIRSYIVTVTIFTLIAGSLPYITLQLHFYLHDNHIGADINLYWLSIFILFLSLCYIIIYNCFRNYKGSYKLLHGKTSQVFHHKQGVLADLPSPFTATRYHSLAVERDTVPSELEVTSETEDGVIMSLRHKDFDIEGVQFHPESVLTDYGHEIVRNFLQRCKK